MTGVQRQRGVVLLVVLFFTLLLVASISTFLKRATVDAIISRNRDAMVQTEALARGGIELAKALLIEDRAIDAFSGVAVRFESGYDRWMQAQNAVIQVAGGAELRLRIEDSGSRLNLNALFQAGEDGLVPDRTQAFLVAFLERMIEETPIDVQALYDPRELAENLIDFVDPDEMRLAGGLEDDYYQKQSPSYRAPNRPLMSVDELRLVEGFDATLVDVIRPYITVHPLSGGGGVNPNTAPPHILGLIFYNDGVDLRFAKDDDVRRILEVRDEGQVVCETATHEACVAMNELLPNTESIHPPLAYSSDTFTVHSEARFGEVRRTVEATIDRTTLTDLLLLSWKVR
jgi:general secretion pathway protein K